MATMATGVGVGGGFFAVIAMLYIGQIDTTIESNKTILQTINHDGAAYAAESQIDKTLYNIKSQDVDLSDKVNSYTYASKGTYDKINRGAETTYFDLKLNNAPTNNVDLGPVTGSDLFFKSLKTEDRFDTLYLNYNKGTSENILVEIVRFDKYNSSMNNCDYYELIDKTCTVGEKLVINTTDSKHNGTIDMGLTSYYTSGTNGYNNQLKLFGFNFLRYDYRFSFNTLKGTAISSAYYATANGKTIGLPNNFIELEVTGNAIDNYARIKLQKNINTNLQPNVKYVLFSNTTLAK